MKKADMPKEYQAIFTIEKGDKVFADKKSPLFPELVLYLQWKSLAEKRNKGLENHDRNSTKDH